jgi:hypothetical protein
MPAVCVFLLKITIFRDPKNSIKMKSLLSLTLIALASATGAQVPIVCFTTLTTSPVAASGPAGIVSADFNADGFMDIATANDGADNISVFFGAGNGTFAAAVNYAAGIDPQSLAVGDFNTDGKPDLAVANHSSDNVSIFLNTGTGSFAPAANYSSGTNSDPTSIAVADFNNDSKPDLAVAAGNISSVRIMLNSGTATFNGGYYVTSNSPAAVISNFFNNDLLPDIATADASGSGMTLKINTGTNFNTGFGYGANPNAWALTTGDYNGDGHADIAVSKVQATSNVVVYYGNGNGQMFSGPVLNVNGTPLAIISANFNGDTFTDLAVSSMVFPGPNVTILLGAGQGSFAPAVSYSVGTLTGALTSADFNVDGRPDIAVLEAGFTDNVHIMLNHSGPAISLSASNNVSCAGEPVSLSVSGANTYTWSAGGNGSAIVVMPTVTSVYSVTGDDGLSACNNTVAITITVNPAPTLTINSPAVCEGSTATLTVIGADTYTWSHGPQTSITMVTPLSTTVYSVSGTYSATGCRNMATSTLVVNPLPLVTSNNGTICEGQTFTLVPAGAINYTFSGGSATVNPVTTTAYTVTGSDANGCAATVVAMIHVKPAPVVTVNSGSICAGSLYTMQPPPGASIQALAGTSINSVTTGSAILAPASDATYTITFLGTNGCISAPSLFSVAVSPVPVLSITASGAVICPGETATLTVNGATTYVWNTTSTANTIAVTPLQTTTYSVVGSFPDGCSSNDLMTLTVDPCTGIVADKKDLSHLRVYPNPAHGIFFIETSTEQEIKIMNAAGQIVLHTQLPAGKHEIDLSAHQAGLYFLVLMNGATLKMVKE